MKDELSKLSLREKKYATLKLKILDTLISKIQDKSLEDISVKEIARDVEISEMTFYNYFKNKKELLIYFIQLWNIEMNLHVEEKQPLTSLKSIYLIFEKSAIKIEQNYQFMMEIIAYIALNGVPKKDIPITKAEMILNFGSSFPYKNGGFRELILPLISDAIEKKEIDKQDEREVFVGLHNTFFATPLLVDKSNVSSLKKLYQQQINNILHVEGT